MFRKIASMSAVVILLLLLAGVIVNVVMLMDCLKRDFKDRTMWIIILIVGTLLGFGAIPGVLYYFLVKKKLETEEKEEKEEKKE
jgi:phosphotransferase system  glucose/maltose/N-acetylglucosamine-specific IIC component